MPHLNNKQNKNTNQLISRQDYHLTQPLPSEEKQTNKQTDTQHKPHHIQSLHKPLHQAQEGRNQKEERTQPRRLGKGDLKHNKLKKISELENKIVETTSEEQNKVKSMKITEDSLRDIWDNIKRTNTGIIGVPEEEEKKKGYEKLSEEIIVENFPNMKKEIVNQV